MGLYAIILSGLGVSTHRPSNWCPQQPGLSPLLLHSFLPEFPGNRVCLSLLTAQKGGLPRPFRHLCSLFSSFLTQITSGLGKGPPLQQRG